MQWFLDHPIVRYLIISTVSVLASVIFFKLGGSLAEVSGTEDKLLGFGFKASGAIGGFFIIFWISLRSIEKLTPVGGLSRLKVYVVGKPKNFSSSDGRYTCQGQIYNAETGETRTFNAPPRWEAGFLTLDFRDLGPSDLIGAEIKNAQNQIWQVEYFDPRTNAREIPNT